MKQDSHQINNSLVSSKLTPDNIKDAIIVRLFLMFFVLFIKCKQVKYLKLPDETPNEIYFLTTYSTKTDSFISIVLYNSSKNVIETKQSININLESKKLLGDNCNFSFNDIDMIDIIYSNEDFKDENEKNIDNARDIILLLTLFNYKKLEFNLVKIDLCFSNSKLNKEKLFSVKQIKQVLKSKVTICFDISTESNKILIGTTDSIYTLNLKDYERSDTEISGLLSVLQIDTLDSQVPIKLSLAINNFNGKQVAYGKGSRLILVNTEDKKITAENGLSHSNGIINIKFNNLKPFTIATTGFDSCIKFWDSRNLSEPIYVISNNPHWTLDLAFHKIYNRILLSSLSSSMVRLVIFDQSDEYEMKTSLLNKVDYLEFDESVFSICWADNDQWIFAAVSYNGFIHINKVPDDIKFKIMID